MKCSRICGNVRLSYKLIAEGIYIFKDGSITITAMELPMGTKIPRISVEWLETMCLRESFKEMGQAFTISDVLARDGVITYSESHEIYKKIESHLNDITLISL